jgi:hypothetical protein
MKCGCKWRRDEPLVAEDAGGTETSGGRSQWCGPVGKGCLKLCFFIRISSIKKTLT